MTILGSFCSKTEAFRVAKKNVTLRIDSEIYDVYRDYCKENAVMLSRKVEIFMKKELENNKKTNQSEGSPQENEK